MVIGEPFNAVLFVFFGELAINKKDRVALLFGCFVDGLSNFRKKGVGQCGQYKPIVSVRPVRVALASRLVL